MKQTNNAIKFLLAQYRAIYKNAFLKGVLGVTLLAATAGVAQAQAPQVEKDPNAVTAISGQTSITGAKYLEYKLDKDTTINGGLTINSTAEKNNNSIKGVDNSDKAHDKKSTLTFNGNLSLSAADGTKSGSRLVIGGSNSAGLKVNFNGNESTVGANSTLAILGACSNNKGTEDGYFDTTAFFKNLTVNGEVRVAPYKKNDNKGHATLDFDTLTNNGTINVGDYYKLDDSVVAGAGSNEKKATIGHGLEKGKASVLTMNQGSELNVKTDETAKVTATINGQIVGNGGAINFLGTQAAGTAISFNAFSGHEDSVIAAQDLDLSIAAGLTVDVALDSIGKGENTQRGVLSFGQGSKVSLDSEQSKAGAVLDIKSKNGVGSIVEFKTGSILTASGTAGSSVAAIKVTGGDSGNIAKSELRIDGNTLLSFLAADEVQKATDLAGSVVLGAKSVLDITGTDKVSLGTGASTSCGDEQNLKLSVASGKGSVGGTVVVSGDTTLKADHIAVESNIANDALKENLSLEAVNLSLNNFRGGSSDALGFKTASAQNLTFVKEDFALANEINLSSADTGTITGAAILATGGSLNINKGNYTSNAGLVVSGGTLAIAGERNSQASLAVNTLDVKSGTVKVDGNLTVKGTSGTSDFANAQGTTFNVGSFGSLTLEQAALEDVVSFNADTKKAEVTLGNTIGFASNSKLNLKFSSATTVSKDDLATLKKGFGGADFAGVLNIGDAKISGFENIVGSNNQVKWDEFKDLIGVAGSNVTTEAISNATVTGVNGAFQGTVGSIQTSGASNATIGGSTEFANAANNGNKFVSNASGDLADINVTGNGTSLTLTNNNGAVAQAGNIKFGNDSSLAVATNGTGSVSIESVTGSGSFTANASSTTVNSNVEVENVVVATDKSLTAQNLKSSKDFLVETNAKAQTGESGSLTVGGNFTAETNSLTNVGTDLKVNGNFDVQGQVNAKTLSLGSSAVIAQNGIVKTTNLTAAKNQDIRVGTEGEKASAGYLFADNVQLNGATLVVDPEYGSAASIVGFKSFGVAKAATANHLGTIDGNIVVGKNSFVGLGVDEQGARTVAARFQDDAGSLDSKGYGAILYLAQGATLDSGKQIAVNGSQNFDNKVDADADLALGANSALVIEMDAFTNGDKPQAALTFKKSGATVSADNGATVVLAGIVDPTKEITVFSGTNLNINNSTGGINVLSESGLYSGVVGKDGKAADFKIVAAEVDKLDISTPIKETFKGYAQAVEEAKKNGQKEPSNILASGSNDAKTTEQAARLSIYGGVAQAALAVSNATSDAIAGRLGMGSAVGNVTTASNAQGTALWLTPVYKTTDSDGFASQGVNYGVDVDFYGLALGADFTLANGLRIGGVFNVGSGDADGNQMAAGVKNDFNYYGLGAYVAYNFNNFSIVGDASFTTVDNDLSANSASASIGKLTASTDATAISLGVTAQYALDFAGFTVTPHGGLRYTSFDLDDYKVKTEKAGDQIDFKEGSLSVFAIPVGVTFAKNIQMGEWIVKPSFDLTLTANVGDDEVGGDAHWIGVDGFQTALKSEFIDNFTYSATAGVAVSSGAFSLGAGFNYTGSSNTNGYGISVNTRFVF